MPPAGSLGKTGQPRGFGRRARAGTAFGLGAIVHRLASIQDGGRAGSCVSSVCLLKHGRRECSQKKVFAARIPSRWAVASGRLNSRRLIEPEIRLGGDEDEEQSSVSVCR